MARELLQLRSGGTTIQSTARLGARKPAGDRGFLTFIRQRECQLPPGCQTTSSIPSIRCRTLRPRTTRERLAATLITFQPARAPAVRMTSCLALGWQLTPVCLLEQPPRILYWYPPAASTFNC